MLLRYFYFYIGCISVIPIYTIEYIYPVGSINNGETIFLIHQTSSNQVELLEWNTQNNTIEQALWSIFNPSRFQLLFNNEGFSFFDKGRLCIKFFNKRSPKAIDFDEPLFNINFFQWIDIRTCYCSAQQNNEYALFHLTDKGEVCCIAATENKDYMYPQKIDNHYFYIERDKTNISNEILYHIMHAECPAIERKLYNDLYVPENILLSAKMIIDFQEQPIIFLNMISNQEGFVIEHQKKIDTCDITMTFFYYHIKKENDTWYKKRLFSFIVPASLLTYGNNEALYESILPLLPQVFEHKIYFVSCKLPESYNLKPYCYNLKKNICEKIIVPIQISQAEGHIFVPMLYGNTFYCGGTKIAQECSLISFLT